MDNITQQQVTAVRALTKELPMNDFGLPIGLYRLDMLPWYDYVAPDSVPIDKLIEAPTTTLVTVAVKAPLLEEGDLEFADSLLNDDSSHITVSDDKTTTEVVSLVAEPEIHRLAGFPTNGLEGAFIWLSYDEGFPAFHDGSPMWNQICFEPPEAFAIFQRYLQMHRGSVGKDEEIGPAATGTRSIEALAVDLHGNVDLLDKMEEYSNYFHMYYWNLRAKAYDIFRVAQHRKQQEIRAIETEDSHYITARKYMHKLQDFFDNEEDFWDMLTPKTAIDFLKTLTQLERVSAGLPAGGPAMPKDGTPSTAQSLEVAFRSIAQDTNNHAIDHEGGDSTVLRDALQNPADVEVLQELIIRVQGGKITG